MELTQEDVIQILKFLDESNFDEIRFEKDGLKLTVIKGSQRTPPQEFELSSKEPKRSQPPEQPAFVEVNEALVSATQAAPKNTVTQAEQTPIGDDNLVPIKASMLGTFYRSPKPGAPPFVEVGSFVKEDTTVCLIEVMKCFSTIKAKVPGGYIVKVLAQDGQMVEYGQELFLVGPAEKLGGTV